MKPNNNESRSVIKSIEDIKKLGTILGVWAHPDDETFSSAGIMAAANLNGQRVVCLTATKGEAGSGDESKWPTSQLATIRSQELERAFNVLDINRHHWLGYKDGYCEKSDQQAVNYICDYINKYDPDTILTFGYDGMTGHPDHQAVCAWVDQANKLQNKKIAIYHVITTEEQYNNYLYKFDKKLNIFYNIDKPKLIKAKNCNICFELPKNIKELKYQALKAMPSQTSAMFEMFSKQEIYDTLSPETFVKSNI